jgi:hypothetical protein
MVPRSAIAVVVACAFALALPSAVLAAHAQRVNVSGSYTYFSHVQAGVSLGGTLTLHQSGSRLTGSATFGSGTVTLKGTIRGTAMTFTFFGAHGYIVHETGTAACGGTELSGGWVDNAQENGSWNAYRGGATPTTIGCPHPSKLDVKILVLERVRSGLALHVKPYLFYPADFEEPKNSMTTVCESGCADVLVTVTDHRTHKPVPGTTVKAAVGAIAHVVTGAESLCGTTGRCATAISDQETDESGQVLLTYWAPGVIEPTSAKLRVTATCSASTCPAEKPGAAEKTLHVMPYLIYQHSGEWTAHEADLLAEWAHGTRAFTKFLKTIPWAEKIVEGSAGFLEGLELGEESVTKALAAIEVAEPVLGAVAIATELYTTYTELSEREEMIGLFLEKSDLRPAGLGGPSFEAFGLPFPSAQFENELANAGTFLPFATGADGLLWRFAGTLAGLKHDRDPAFGSQSTELKVYEVSHCDPEKGHCGMGYGNIIGTDNVVNLGIQSELYFEFKAQHNDFAHTFTTSFTIPYNAVIWREVQPNLMGLLP